MTHTEQSIIPYNQTGETQLDKDGTLGVPLDIYQPTKASVGEWLEHKKRDLTSDGMRGGVDGEPVPPMKFIRGAEHHWLEKKDCDGHSGGLIVLQWNPGAKRWSHSGYVGTGIYVNTKHWVYHSHCPIPD